MHRHIHLPSLQSSSNYQLFVRTMAFLIFMTPALVFAMPSKEPPPSGVVVPTSGLVNAALIAGMGSQNTMLRDAVSRDSEVIKNLVYNSDQDQGERGPRESYELSLLDAISKDLGQSIETTVGSPPLAGNFQYTAVLGDNSPSAFGQLVAQYVGLGFGDFKIKITGEVQNDNEKLSLVLDAVPDARIRLDANNIWGTVEEVSTYLHSLSVAPFALEEPLQPRAFDELNRLLRTTSVPIILDESFLNIGHFDLIDTSQHNVIVNIRISKMGGLMRARSIARLLSDVGVPLIVGAQVGETSLLTRAGLCLANEFKECVIAEEGAFGTLLLETDVTNESLMFGSKGRLACPGAGQDVAAHGFEIRYKSDLFGSDASDS